MPVPLFLSPTPILQDCSPKFSTCTQVLVSGPPAEQGVALLNIESMRVVIESQKIHVGFQKKNSYKICYPDISFPDQRFSTSVLREFLRHVIPGYVVRVTDLLSLRLSHLKVTIANTTRAIWFE